MTVLAFHGVKGLGENSLCSQAWTQWSMIAGITLVGLVFTINHKLLLQLLVQTVCTPNPLHFGLALGRDDSGTTFHCFSICPLLFSTNDSIPCRLPIHTQRGAVD